MRYWILPLIYIAERSTPQGLRIDLSMRYNAFDKGVFSQKTARTDVDSIYTHLTQPTGSSGGLGWKYYTSHPFRALVGFHRGVLRCNAG